LRLWVKFGNHRSARPFWAIGTLDRWPELLLTEKVAIAIDVRGEIKGVLAR
jgi:hypothetical protein